MTKQFMSSIGLAFLLVAPCASFSSLAAPAAATKGIGNPLASTLVEFKRSGLKKRLVAAADAKDEAEVLRLVEELAPLNPNPYPTYGLGGYGGGTGIESPLDGEWKLLFTNAKDAEAPARTEKKTEADGSGIDDGAVKEGVRITTGQRIDADAGQCINYICAEGEGRPFDNLEITIQMTALSPERVRLDFRRGRARNENAPLGFLKDVSFNFPPAFVGDGLARLKGKDPKVEPPAYFDVLYIDGQVRAHRTGEGKIFVQARI